MPLRVMHLLASNKYAGAEHVAVDIIKYLFQKNNDVEFVYVSPQGEISKTLEREGINYIGLASLSFREVYRVVRDFSPDIIHAHDYKASCIAALIPGKMKVISHIHHNNKWAKSCGIKNLLYMLLSFRLNKIAIVSSSIIEEFSGSSIFRNKTLIVPNVVNEHEVVRKAMDYERVYGQSGSIDYLFVGRLTEEKDPIRFLHLLKRLKAKGDTFYAAIIGKGPMEDEVRNEIESADLSSCVKFLGFLDNPYPYMKKAKTLVMPSVWEGFGLVAVEAMLLGCRVLVTPVGGLQELVKEYNKEWICHSDNEFIRQMEIEYNKEESEDLIHGYASGKNDVESFVSCWKMLYGIE